MNEEKLHIAFKLSGDLKAAFLLCQEEMGQTTKSGLAGFLISTHPLIKDKMQEIREEK